MYSDLLEELIDSVLKDGILTEQTREIIKRRAEKDGEDTEEVLMIVESRLRKLRNRPIQETILKKKISKNLRKNPGLTNNYEYWFQN